MILFTYMCAGVARMFCPGFKEIVVLICRRCNRSFSQIYNNKMTTSRSVIRIDGSYLEGVGFYFISNI